MDAAYLEPARFVTSTDPAVVAFAREVTRDAADDRDRAVRLYYAVRDQVRYDQWSVRLTPEAFTASHCLSRRIGFCIPKATLLAAAARASGIPARIGFADVKNHLTTGRLSEVMRGCEVYVWHAYAELWIEGRWVKATPAFDGAICRRMRVAPLEFDGRTDSLFQPYNVDRRLFMEYVNDRGTFADVPFETIAADFLRLHPGWIEASAATPESAAEAS